MKKIKLIFPIFIFTIFLFSCSSSSDADQKKIDSMYPQQNVPANSGNKDSATGDNANDKPEKPFHLSPADSTKVADSVYNSKNGVRDFN